MVNHKGRGGKRGRKGKRMQEKRELVYKEDGQEYGQAIKMLGNGTATIHCFDGKQRLGVICGRMRNRVWIATNDIVLISLRENEDSSKKCDIILKYFPEEAKQLKALGELPENTVIDERKAEEAGVDDLNIKYDEDSEEEEEEDDRDDDLDMPPGSSDEEFWEKENKKEAIKLENKAARKQKFDEGNDDEEEVMEEKPKISSSKGKVDTKKADNPEDKKDLKNVKKIEKKDAKNDKKKKQDEKKKKGKDSSDSDDGGKDNLDDI
jgi:translation initiation factor 1A